MNPKAKTALIWILVAFAIYAVVTSPEQAANVIESILTVIVNAIESIGRFFSSLLN